MQLSDGRTLVHDVNNCLVLSEERRFQLLFSFTVSSDCGYESAGLCILLLEKEPSRRCAGDADIAAFHCFCQVAGGFHCYLQLGGQFIRKPLGATVINVICKDLLQRENLRESLNRYTAL